MHDEDRTNAEPDLVDVASAEVSSMLSKGATIDAEEVFEAQRSWATGVVEIGALYVDGGDYMDRTRTLVDLLYGHAESPVLFKPTMAFRQPFRATRNETISYFTGGVVDEDLGFALRPWERVRFGEQRLALLGTTAVSMGHYFFTDAKLGHEILAEFTFGYFRSRDGSVKINVHHSSLPYASPQAATGKS